MAVKTNTCRQLDKLGIAYQLKDYKVDATTNDLSAIRVAAEIGLPAKRVFKTLVARGDVNGILLAVVPADHELDLKALARVSGNRRVNLAPLDQLQSLTGYARGGVTVLGCKRSYPVFIDESVRDSKVISVSAGVRGTQILLAPRAYITATTATLASFCSPSAAS